MSFTRFFHLISYLQYPLMAIALYFIFTPYIIGFDIVVKNPQLFFNAVNKTLLFAGLGISFSTLQDTAKAQNKFSRKIWESPRKGKAFIIFICCQIVLLLSFALYGYFVTTNPKIKELSLGTFVLAIGMISLLKAGVEMYENHQKAKQS